MRAHLLAPAGFTERPSGGNLYDRHLRAGLVARGWDVRTHEVTPDDVGSVAAGLRPAAVVLVDSLVASWAPEAFLGVPAVPLVHMLFDVPGERELLAEAPAVITTSEWTRRQVLRRGVDPRRAHVAIPGVARAVPTAGSSSGGELLCVAAPSPAKGQDVLLAALAELTDLDWTCTLAGSLETDPAFVDTLRKQAADAGITDRVRFLGELTDLGETYAASDLAVLPSRAETYGMVVTEALAAGLPVLASAVGGVPEALGTVGGDRPGMLVRPEDAGALARSLRRWLEDPSLRRWLRRTVAARRASLPSWQATAAAVAVALEGVR